MNPKRKVLRHRRWGTRHEIVNVDWLHGIKPFRGAPCGNGWPGQTAASAYDEMPADEAEAKGGHACQAAGCRIARQRG
jgi:hypothetical protein